MTRAVTTRDHSPKLKAADARQCRVATSRRDVGQLCELALEVRDAWLTSQQRTVELTIQLGKVLLDVKAGLPHGAWLPWLDTTFGTSIDSAERFMYVARNSAHVRNLPADSSTRALVEHIRTARREAPALARTETNRPLPSAGQLPSQAHVDLADTAALRWASGSVDLQIVSPP